MRRKDLKTGDLIGVAGLESDWGAAIVASSKHNPKAVYDHVGMIEKTDEGDLFVWNANPHDGVIREGLKAFLVREEVQVPKIFGLYRLWEAVDYEQVLVQMRPLLGLPYNFSFIQSARGFYCSDFISRTFPADLFPLENMHFEGNFWSTYFADQGIDSIPEGQLGINPSDLLASDKLEYLGDLTRKDG